MNIQKPINLVNKGNSEIIKLAEKSDVNSIKDLLYGVKKDFQTIQKYLKEKCNEYATNAFQYDNYVIIPAKEDSSKEIERVALKLDIFGSKSTLRLKERIELEDKANLYVFITGDGKKTISRYNSRVVTDSAKKDFYLEMKKLVESGKVDKNEILNDKLWYMTEDGQEIYNLSPNVTGYLPYSDKERVEKNLFDILFNGK